MTSAFCRTLVLIAACAALPAVGMLQAEPLPASPELPTRPHLEGGTANARS